MFKLFFPFEGADDKKQTDSMLDSFEYFHEKGKEKEDDLHKSYNDRSYLSSEDMGPVDSRTGKPQNDTPMHKAELNITQCEKIGLLALNPT